MNVLRMVLPLTMASMIILMGCDPSAQDSPSATKISVKGVSEDGYVSGGIVWHDLNMNYALDAGEPFAITDEEGYFSRSRTGTDYCASTATDAQKRKCLQVNAEKDVSKDIIIRLQKGVDIVTSEPFSGSISMKATINSDGSIADVVVTPITALLAHMNDTEAKAFATREGLTLAELKSDFLDFIHKGTNATANQPKLIKAALQVHKTVELVNEMFKKRYDILVDTPKVGSAAPPSDASDFIYAAIVKAFKNTPSGTLSDFMVNTTPTVWATIFDSAENNLRSALSTIGYVAGTDYPTTSLGNSNSLWTNLGGRVDDTTTHIATAVPTSGTTINKSEMFARARAVEVIKETIKTEIKKTVFVKTSTTPTTAPKLGASGSGTEVPGLTNANKFVSRISDMKAAGENFDLAAAVVKISDGTTSDTTVLATGGLSGDSFRSSSAKVYIPSTSNFVVDSYVQLSFGTVGSGANGKALIFFSRDDADKSKSAIDVKTGSVSACNKYDDGKSTTSVYETTGKYVGGQWRILDDFSIQVNGVIAGNPRTIIVKSTGMDTTVTPNKRKYTADINSGSDAYTAEQDLTLTTSFTGTVPTTDAECKTLLK